MDVSSLAAQGTAMSTEQLQMEVQVMALKKQMDVQKLEGQAALELINSLPKSGGVDKYA